MPNHGRLLHAKHLFPFVFAPWFQLRRLLLRLDWALFAPLRVASLWTFSAVCGVVGVIGSIALFLFNTPPTPVAASTVEPSVVERIAITIPTELGPSIPFNQGPLVPQPVAPPIPTKTTWSNIQVQFSRTHLANGWNLREKQVLTSVPERPPYAQNLYAMRDGWFTMDLGRHGQMFRDTIQPYISRQGVTALQLAPSFTAADAVDPAQPVTKVRNPALVVSRENETPASLHQEMTYALVVANPSPELIESAIVEERISALHRVVNTDPPASLTTDGNALQWNVANLRPGENRRLRVTLSPESSDPVQHETIVTVTSRVAASTAIRAPFVPPEVPPTRPTPQPTQPVARAILELELEQPQQVDIGGDVRAFFVIRNIGNAPARDVLTYVTISNQLDHRYGEYLENRIAELAPGDTRRIKFYAVGAKPGTASLTSKLSSANAPPVSKVFQIAINDTARNGQNLAQPGGPGVGDPRSFPGQPGPTGPPNNPPNGPRSTVPSISRLDRDDGLPTRVPSTVPGGTVPNGLGGPVPNGTGGAGPGGLGSNGFNNGNSGGFQPVNPAQPSGQPYPGAGAGPGIGPGNLTGNPYSQQQPGAGSPYPQDGNWRGNNPGEQLGPMTSPFGTAPPNGTAPGFAGAQEPRGNKSTVPSTSRPDLDDSLPLRVQSTVPEGSFPPAANGQGNNGGTMLRSGEQPGFSNGGNPNGFAPQENTPLNTFPPGVGPGPAPRNGNIGSTPFPGNGNGLENNPAPDNGQWRTSGGRNRGPGRDPRNGVSSSDAGDPRFAPQGPSNDQGNVAPGFPGGAPANPPFRPQPGNVQPNPTDAFPGFGNPPAMSRDAFPGDQSEPQSLRAKGAPERTRGPGRTVPADEQGVPTLDGAQPGPGGAPGVDLFAPNPNAAPAMGRDRSFVPPNNEGGTLNDPFPAGPTGPAGPADSSIPRGNGSSFLIEDPVNSTIPGGARQYGPMPAVEPQHYPSVVPGYGPSYGQPGGGFSGSPFGQPNYGQPFGQPNSGPSTAPSFGQPAGSPFGQPANPGPGGNPFGGSGTGEAGGQPFVPQFEPQVPEPAPAQPFPNRSNTPTPAGDSNAKPI